MTDLTEALDAWANGTPWSQAFGQTRRQYRARQRDLVLRQVARLAEVGPQELHHLCNRFESTVWPRWSHLPSPPDNAGQLHRLLHQARKWGPFPSSVRQYYTVLN